MVALHVVGVDGGTNSRSASAISRLLFTRLPFLSHKPKLFPAPGSVSLNPLALPSLQTQFTKPCTTEVHIVFQIACARALRGQDLRQLAACLARLFCSSCDEEVVPRAPSSWRGSSTAPSLCNAADKAHSQNHDRHETSMHTVCFHIIRNLETMHD